MRLISTKNEKATQFLGKEYILGRQGKKVLKILVKGQRMPEKQNKKNSSVELGVPKTLNYKLVGTLLLISRVWFVSGDCLLEVKNQISH